MTQIKGFFTTFRFARSRCIDIYNKTILLGDGGLGYLEISLIGFKLHKSATRNVLEYFRHYVAGEFRRICDVIATSQIAMILRRRRLVENYEQISTNLRRRYDVISTNLPRNCEEQFFTSLIRRLLTLLLRKLEM